VRKMRYCHKEVFFAKIRELISLFFILQEKIFLTEIFIYPDVPL